MAKIANVALTNTFDFWRTGSNEAFHRLSQFAVNESSLYANTITANVSFAALNDATIGNNLVVSGNTTSNKVFVLSSINGSVANLTFNKATVISELNLNGSNTFIGKLYANNSLGSDGFALKTNGSGEVWWGPVSTDTSSYLTISSAASTYQTKTIERAALANTNNRINSTLANRLGATATVALTGDITGTATAFSSNAVSISTTASSAIMKNSVAFTKTTGNVTFNDNVYAHFGTDQDLQIVHTGSYGYLTNQTGTLYITSTAGMFLRVGSNETAISAAQNGSVILFYDNAQKFATTSAGASVTGNLTATGSITASAGASVTGNITATGSITATSFSGTGTSLTALNATQITTGTIPNAARFGTTLTPQFASLGVGTAASGTTGEIRATNNITAYYSSDIRLKTNIKEISDPLWKIDQIRGVEFDWTEEYLNERGGEDGYFVRKHDVGIIAQEIEKVLPEVVAERDDGIKAVKYDRIVALLIEAVKTLSSKVKTLEENNNE